MAVNTILCGNSYSRILRDPVTNEPLEYVFYPPSAVSIESENDYETYYYMIYPPHGNKQIRCEPEDIIHWKFLVTIQFTDVLPCYHLMMKLIYKTLV